jgi:hypothetical protein
MSNKESMKEIKNKIDLLSKRFCVHSHKKKRFSLTFNVYLNNSIREFYPDEVQANVVLK